MKKWKTMSDIRREYGNLSLNKKTMAKSPFEQFEAWFKEVLDSEVSDPTSMVLSTVDERGRPDSRIVLLKGIVDNTFVFYTNYQSEKAKQIDFNQSVALNFYWPQTARQVRVRGLARKVSAEQSDAYFESRPIQSQYSAIISPQSQVIKGRTELEDRFNTLVAKHQQEPVLRPEHWGGYAITPEEFEFWQGRDNRLHDRIQYYLNDKGIWSLQRLAP